MFRVSVQGHSGRGADLHPPRPPRHTRPTMPTPRSLLRVAPLAVAIACSACGLLFEPKPDVAAPTHYDEHGLAFDFPGNWNAKTETDSTEGIATTIVTVESTGSGIAMVQQFKPPVPIDPDETLNVLTTEMRKSAGEQLGGVLDYTQGGSTPGQRTMLGAERQTRRAHFEIALLGNNLPHTVELVTAELEDRTIVVMLQAADEDLPTVTPAFEQIVTSLAVR